MKDKTPVVLEKTVEMAADNPNLIIQQKVEEIKCKHEIIKSLQASMEELKMELAAIRNNISSSNSVQAIVEFESTIVEENVNQK